MTESYPRLAARTLNFTLGIPRNITVNNKTVYFIRTASGNDRVGQLWAHGVERGTDYLVADPHAILGAGEEQLSDEERARRERARETAGGIVSYSIDDEGRWASFALSGRLFATHLPAQITREIEATSPVIDPQIDPTGRLVAYASNNQLRLVSVKGEDDRAIVEPDGPDVVWGQAEFIAAEEFSRHRGFWWAPEGESLLIARVDNSPIQKWHFAEPADPSREPHVQRYPAAGTPNAEVTLWHVTVSGQLTKIEWDSKSFEYLTRVSWTKLGEPLIQVLSRDQKTCLVLSVDVVTGKTQIVREIRNEAWVDMIDTPHWNENKQLITIEDNAMSRQLCVDGKPISPGGWYVRSVVKSLAEQVLVTYSTEPHIVHVAWLGLDGSINRLTEVDAVHGAVASDSTVVISRAGLDSTAPTIEVNHLAYTSQIAVNSHRAPLEARPTFHRVGDHQIPVAVFFPTGYEMGSRKLPVVMDPYGGPQFQRVLANARMHLTSQWLADQGFAVIVADGRGTPGVNPNFERAILHEFAKTTLDDQVTALHEIAALYPNDIDTTRVGITGWSYGGYLSALAVLRRPDVFHAAVAGAPVTEWRLYDTGYTERYLGDPNAEPRVYDRNSLVHLAPELRRPLMLIHGLADDNVVAAHSLQLSAELTANGKPHTFLPLVGVTHMTPQEEVAENLKLLQIDFLKNALS